MGPIQNACAGKGVRDAVSRFVGYLAFPKQVLYVNTGLLLLTLIILDDLAQLRTNKDLCSLRNIRCSTAHRLEFLYPSHKKFENRGSFSLLNVS